MPDKTNTPAVEGLFTNRMLDGRKFVAQNFNQPREICVPIHLQPLDAIEGFRPRDDLFDVIDRDVNVRLRCRRFDTARHTVGVHDDRLHPLLKLTEISRLVAHSTSATT